MREVLQILNDEFRLSMALSGESDANLKEIAVIMLIYKQALANIPASLLLLLLFYIYILCIFTDPGCRNVAEINRNLIQFSKL